MVTSSVLPALIKKPNIPCITINHGQDVTLPFAPYQWYIKKVFKKLDGVISVSTATKKASVQRGMDSEKGVALPNGFDMNVLKNLPEKKEARNLIEKEFSIDLSDKKLLLSVGRQVKRKGHEWFISEVLSKVRTNVIYLIVGDGPENENIVNARENSDQKEKIVIVGKQSQKNLFACYAAAYLFRRPNIPVDGEMEGFGIVILEANIAGVPAIASDLEGIKDVIMDGKNGYKIPAGCMDLFAKKIDYVLEEELSELSARSKKYVKKKYNWDTVVDQYISFLKCTANKASN